MAIAVQVSNYTGYLTTDQGATFSLSGTSSATGHLTYWDCDYDIFSSRYGDTSQLSTKPKTVLTTVRAYKVRQMAKTGADNLWTYRSAANSTITAGSDTYGKLASNSSGVSAWNCYAVGSTADSTKTTAQVFKFFIEAVADQNNKECALGFVTSAALTAYSPAVYKHGFLLRADGKYVIISDGSVVQTRMLFYKAGDRFRVERDGSWIKYKQNGQLIHKVAFTQDNSKPVYYPAHSFNGVSASFSKSVVYGKAVSVGSPAVYTNSHDSDYYAQSASLQIYAVCPDQPHYGYKITKDNATLTSVAEDGSTVLRKKSRVRSMLSLEYKQRSYDEFKEMLEFWNHHQRHLPFIYRDIGKYDKNDVDEYLVRFENQMDYTIEGPNSVSWNLALKEI